MYFIFTRRVVRHARSIQGGDRYAARHDNVESWHVSGPFSSSRVAERAALAALATHTCLGAQVYSRDQLAALVQASDHVCGDYELKKRARQALQFTTES